MNKPATQAEAHALLPALQDMAIQAGQKILQIYERSFNVSSKADGTPLTAADMSSHELIISKLTELTPDIPTLSEESEPLPFETRSRWRRHWLIDPLDGTREFIKRNDEFSVNIALVEDHEPVLGVVHSPVRKISYYACRGYGAYKKETGCDEIQITTRNTSVDNVIVVGSRSHASQSLKAFLTRLGRHELIHLGSALKTCLVAEGAADIYPRFGSTYEWDTAAAQCILEEAGGAICDLNMERLGYNTEPSLENPWFIAFGDPNFDWCKYL